jgi:hypothetical protein
MIMNYLARMKLKNFKKTLPYDIILNILNKAILIKQLGFNYRKITLNKLFWNEIYKHK